MMIGPMMNPAKPKTAIPPNVAKNIKSGCISVSLPTSLGRRTLSMTEIIPMPTEKMKIPCQISPSRNITMPAGNQIRPDPNIGIMEVSVIESPQMAGEGMPAIQKVIPPKKP